MTEATIASDVPGVMKLDGQEVQGIIDQLGKRLFYPLVVSLEDPLFI